MAGLGIGQYFPPAIYNFDVTPPAYESAGMGPIQALLNAANQVVDQFQTDSQALLGNLAVTGATGVFLEAHGALYGVTKFLGQTVTYGEINSIVMPPETDSEFRARIYGQLKCDSTLSGVSTALTLYSNIYLPIAPTVTVWDRQSNPASAAIIDLQPFSFVVSMLQPTKRNSAFYVGYSHAGVAHVMPPESLIYEQDFRVGSVHVGLQSHVGRRGQSFGVAPNNVAFIVGTVSTPPGTGATNNSVTLLNVSIPGAAGAVPVGTSITVGGQVATIISASIAEPNSSTLQLWTIAPPLGSGTPPPGTIVLNTSPALPAGVRGVLEQWHASGTTALVETAYYFTGNPGP